MPTSVFTKFYAFSEDIANKVHDLGADSLRIALSNIQPDETADAVLADITEVSYTYCSSRAVTIVSATQTGGIMSLIIESLLLSASGGSIGPFQYAILYNDTPAGDPLIGYMDYGAALTVLDGKTFSLLFDQDLGILQLQ